MSQVSDQKVQQLDPRTLLVDRNVRGDARLTPDFIASIRDQGVLQPVVAVRTADGGHRVRFGHRRTLAAVAAGRDSVPVLVAADEGTDDAAQVERLVSQYAENEHRTGLTTGERVDVMAQLAAFGVSPAQIAKRTRAKRTEVDAALNVAGSPLARAAADRYDFLDLTQAATVAELEDDPEAVKVLVAAASTGRFDHAAQRLRDERAEVAARAEAVTVLTDAGVRVVDRPTYDDRSAPRRLDTLAHGGDRITAESHDRCPGHAAYVASEWVYAEEQPEDEQDGGEQDPPARPSRQWVPVYVCTAPARYGHVDRYAAAGSTPRPRVADLDPEQAEAVRAQRRDVIESNRAWDSATTVRLAWLRTFVTRKGAPKGSAGFVAGALARDADVAGSIGGNHLAADLLGVQAGSYGRSAGVAALVKQASEPRAAMLGLALVLAGHEDATSRDSWRHVQDRTARYLRFLEANGYALADVERRACGEALGRV
jgi:ParB family chromosome partitioning protein